MSKFQPPVQISLNKINGREISTVLLPRFDSSPKVWETCVFEADGSSDIYDRYTTEAEAIASHNAYIEHLLNAQWAQENDVKTLGLTP